MTSNFSRGSEWRKWDLHIHTPFTKLNDQFSKDINADVWEKYCDRIEKSDVCVFGITDYFSVENYFTFISKHKEYYPDSKKVFFPNVELRLSVSVNKKAEEVNIHIIFSNNALRNNIEDFLSKLNTNITRNGACVSCKNLATLNDYESAGINYGDIKDILKEVFGDDNCYIIIAAANNAGLRPDNSSPRKLNITDEIDKICHGFFGGQQNVDYYLKTDRYETSEESKAKPVIAGSDSHSFEDIDNYLGKRHINSQKEIVKDITWVKAEPIFEGLKQIINEPSRVFIGELPTVIKRVNNNPTKYIKSLELRKAPNSTLEDVWFDRFVIRFNHELVAIIGNKGKGKSALADILGLCANAHIDENDFSFLHRSKFRNPRPNLAKEFTAILTWEGGAPESRSLDASPNLDSPERVKYIPQSFLEKLCTSIDKKVFEEELEKVIFSRLEDHQKLGKGTLREVLNEKKQSLENEIQRIKSEIAQKNAFIVELERKNSSQYRASIYEAVQAKENELNVHNEKEPPRRDAPTETEATKAKTEFVTKQINEYREAIKKELESKNALNSERTKLAQEINELSQLEQNLTAISGYIRNTLEVNRLVFQKYNLKSDKIVQYSINTESIHDLLKGRKTRVSEIEYILSADNPTNPDTIINENEGLIKKLQDELDGVSKDYQEYLTAVQDWERTKSEIIGQEDKGGTLAYYRNISDYLNNSIESELTTVYQIRKELVTHLLEVKRKIADVYRELYEPVSEFISHNKNELSDYNVNIDVALEIIEFESKFFNFVSNGAAGSFYGSTDSRQNLARITEIVDFDNQESVLNWLDNIIEHLRYDKRDGQNAIIRKELKPQLKGAFKEKDFYDFLFSMDYYEPNYQLKLGEKNLGELSPGERGALLLIFYLLLDKRDIPIIIDQPEENLDNQSVYKILVHFIKKAKMRRQIIIVTHNPNLAVVCDAEQVIRMNIAKDDRNTVSMITGGIETPLINQAIVDVLEGTRPAFNNRTNKYEVSK